MPLSSNTCSREAACFTAPSCWSRPVLCDLRSDVLGPLSAEVVEAFRHAAVRPPGLAATTTSRKRPCAARQPNCSASRTRCSWRRHARQPDRRPLWTQPGEAIIADATSHLATNEIASVAGLNSAVLRCSRASRATCRPSRSRRASRSGPGRRPNAGRDWSGSRTRTIAPAGPSCQRPGSVPSPASGSASGLPSMSTARASGTRPRQRKRRRVRSCAAPPARWSRSTRSPALPSAPCCWRPRLHRRRRPRPEDVWWLWRPVGSLAAAGRWRSANGRRVPGPRTPSRAASSRTARLCGERCGIDAPQTNIVMLKLRRSAGGPRAGRSCRYAVRISPYREAGCAASSTAASRRIRPLGAERIAHAVKCSLRP